MRNRQELADEVAADEARFRPKSSALDRERQEEERRKSERKLEQLRMLEHLRTENELRKQRLDQENESRKQRLDQERQHEMGIQVSTCRSLSLI